jgi:hypothetical protein
VVKYLATYRYENVHSGKGSEKSGCLVIKDVDTYRVPSRLTDLAIFFLMLGITKIFNFCVTFHWILSLHTKKPVPLSTSCKVYELHGTMELDIYAYYFIYPSIQGLRTNQANVNRWVFTLSV